MNWIDILKLGFSGFAFVIVFFTYNLHKSAQQKVSQLGIQKMTKRYIWLTVFLSILVVLSSFLDRAFSNNESKRRLSECRSGIERLQTYSKLPNIEPHTLKKKINENYQDCREAFDAFDVR